MAEIKRRKRVGRWVAIACLVVASGAVAWTIYSQSGQLSLAGNTTVPMVAIPVSQIGSEPWFNFKIAGRQIAYPAQNKVNRDYKKVPGLSGVLVVDKGQAPWAGSGWLALAEWQDEQDKIVAGFSFLGEGVEPGAHDIWPCPYVFGKSPRTVKLIPRPEADPIAINLPPNRMPEPKIPSQEVTMGDWTIKFKPKPWISPSFPIRFEVSIEGAKKGEWFFLSIAEPATGTTHLRISPGQPAEFAAFDWQASHATLLRFQKVRRIPLQFNVERTSVTSGSEEIRVHLDDTIVESVSISHSMGSATNALQSSAGYLALQIGNRWLGGEYGVRPILGHLLPITPLEFSDYKAGKVLDGFGYKADSPLGQGELTFELPDPSRYPGTRYTVDRRAR